MAKRRGDDDAIVRGTENVFADLGFPDAVERQAKLRLAYALNQLLEARQLSQAAAGAVLGLTQPKISALRHYKLAGFSVERLMNLLTALDQDVDIVIRRKARSRKGGTIRVIAAYQYPTPSAQYHPRSMPRTMGSGVTLCCWEKPRSQR
jgi:predicted XRE-type DNA-binding protein